jgi:hypothetical protein
MFSQEYNSHRLVGAFANLLKTALFRPRLLLVDVQVVGLAGRVSSELGISCG